jgi:hypothetical protein
VHGGTNDGFVNSLYQDILGRVPDYPSGMNWVQALNNGTSRSAAAGSLFSSPEYLNDLVMSYYQQFLGRGAVQAELASWLQLLQAGATDQVVLSGILGSPEAFGKRT